MTAKKSRTVSEAARAHGKASIASLARDPVTGRLLPKAAAAGAATPPAPKPAPEPKPAPAPPASSNGGAAPAATPFRGRLFGRHPRSSAWRPTSRPADPNPKD